MARVKIDFPEKVIFRTALPVRITDVNYGNHLGNDAMAGILHEARMQWLASMGLSELDAGGHGLIMKDLAISFIREAFYGDVLEAELAVSEFGTASFVLLYRLTAGNRNPAVEIARAQTGMIAFNYDTRKICSLSNALQEAFAR